jgi:F-type H+-transporting ATPase subunit delta
MSVLGFQYAEALFDLAFEEKSVAEMSQTFESFLNLSTADLDEFMTHPKISKQVKKEMIDEFDLPKGFTHFMYVVIDHDRYDLEKDIYAEFNKIIYRQNQVMYVTVYSKKALTQGEKERLITRLKKKHNRDIELKNKLDESIVGGLKVEYEGYVLDDTINNYLQNLKATLKA